MEEFKYNKRAGRVTSVIRQVVTRQGCIFNLSIYRGEPQVTMGRLGAYSVFGPINRISYTALRTWLLSKTK